MKKLLLAMTFISVGAFANEELPSVEEVKESYEYCKEYVENDETLTNKNTEILTCVNEEMAASDYKPFATLAEILAFIKG